MIAAAILAIVTMPAAAEMPPPANLMAYYPLDGVLNVNQTPNLVPGWGNAVLPTSGGSLSGYISVQPGVVGNGLRLDNTTSYIQSGTMDPFTYAGTDAFTTMFWVWTPATLPGGPPGFAFFVNKQQQGVGPYFRTLIRLGDDIQIGTSPDRQTSVISPDPSGRWMHVAITGTKSGTTATWQVYVDGVQILSPGANNTTIPAGGSAYALRFGAAANGGTQAAVNLRVDEYYFYNTVLTETQINGYLNSQITPTGLIWHGQTSANWDSSTFNWDNSTAKYQEGNSVTFDDNLHNDFSNPPNTNINLTTTLLPTTVKVDSAYYPYGFSGAGKLSGNAVLSKSNSASLLIATTNDYSGGTTLRAGELLIGNNLALGVGPVTLFGGTLSSDTATPRTLTNAVNFYNDINTTVTLGTDASAGALTLSDPVDFRGGGRAARFNNSTTFSGGSANGYLSAKSGPGTLSLNGLHNWSGNCVIREGLLALSGATLTNAGPLAPVCNVASGLAKVTVDSSSTVTLTGTAGWLRLGINGDTSATNQVDISGQVWLIGDGRIRMSGGGTIAIANLLPGGEVTLSAIEKEVTGSGFAQFNFNGGTLCARASSPTFFQGIDQANILSGGLTVDSAGSEITIAQALLNGGGGGGLTKVGAGVLTLNGANTYTGTTLCNAGELRFGPAYSGAGTVAVADGAALGCWSDTPGTSVKLSSATLGSSAGARLRAVFSGQSGNPAVPAGYITNLTLNGTILVQVDAANLVVSATPIPLVRYVNLSGSGTVTADVLGGIGGYVTNNTATKTIELVVISITPLVWTGSGTNIWDVGVSLNWKLGDTPVTYLNGSLVRFDDSAVNPAVAMVAQVNPNSIVISNTALAYFLTNSGVGKISSDAPVAITKDGTNIATLGGTNDFSGDVIIKQGILALNNASALGSVLGGTYISNGASLNMKNIALGSRIEPIYVSGPGYGGIGALYSDNPSLSDIDSFRYVRLLGDTTVGSPTGSRFGFTDASATLDCIGGLHKLTKVGGGWFQFEDAFINVGTIEVKDGVLQTGGSTRIATNGSPFILNNGTLRMVNLTTPVDRPFFFTNGTVHVASTAVHTQNKLAGVVTLGTTATFLVEENRVGSVTGEITGPGDLIKTGAGYLALWAANTYTGNTVISNGVLELFEHSTGFPVGSIANSANIRLAGGALDVYFASPWTLEAHQSLTGSGNINGTVQANGTLAPGTSGAMGSLGIGYNLALNGTNIFKITKDGGLANDSVNVAGYLTYGGVLEIVLTGATPLAVNDTFKLFSFPNALPNGGFSEIHLPAGYTWDTSQLIVDGTVRVTGILGPPTLNATLNGNNLQFDWTGAYKLQAQTNSRSVGLSTNWFDYPGGDTPGVMVPIDTNTGTVFFRLSTP